MRNYRGFAKCDDGKSAICVNNEQIVGNWCYESLWVDEDLNLYEIHGFEYYSSDEGSQRDYFMLPVLCETVGQCSGAKDRNGRLIYQGDVVQYNDRLYFIQYNDRFARYECLRSGESETFLFEDSEVVGNIYGNPELIACL